MTSSAIISLFQHTAVTAGVRVRVAVNFMPEQSRIGAGRWFWVYRIRIENERDTQVQLRSRHWRITDSSGMMNRVDGEGVVGETPLLGPGEAHDYVSGCELATNQGAMEGHYTFLDARGDPFDVAIPRFELAAPADSEV